MRNGSVFLTDEDHNIALEALSPTPSAVLPGSCKSFRTLEPTTAEGVAKKYLPVAEWNGLRVTVRVGSILHPTGQEHSTGQVCFVTKVGYIMRVSLTPDCGPVASSTLEGGDALAATYAYCSLRGLQKKSV